MNKDLLYREFGIALGNARKRKHLSQAQFGAKVGLSRTSVTNIECGRQPVQLHQLYRFAAVLQIEVGKLLPRDATLLEAVATSTVDDKRMHYLAEVAKAISRAVTRKVMAIDITTEVEDLLSRFEVNRPPVPVDKIAKRLNIQLLPLPAEDDISGAIIRKADRVTIAINPAHHVNRRRFTIAHELGHYFLHEGLEEHVDEDFRVAWRNADSSKAVNWIEIQANRFAAELLMPTRFLEKDLDELSDFDKRTIVLLAKKYVVSPGDGEG